MPKFHYPKDIKLKTSPLTEAWLEIRWKLKEVTPGSSGFLEDPNYPFALGLFYSMIKDQFSRKIKLNAAKVPTAMVPHVVRHKFQKKNQDWPLLQLGPGVASANYSKPYSWDKFRTLCVYLRNNLIEAYTEFPFDVETTILRYRNAFDFVYSSNDMLDFFKSNLNLELKFPHQIPGVAGSSIAPTSGAIQYTFDISHPKSTGTFLLSTGTRKVKGLEKTTDETKEVILVQLDISSGGEDVPNLMDEKSFNTWLSDSHSVIHEWFFSLIDGPILESMIVKEVK